MNHDWSRYAVPRTDLRRQPAGAAEPGPEAPAAPEIAPSRIAEGYPGGSNARPRVADVRTGLAPRTAAVPEFGRAHARGSAAQVSEAATDQDGGPVPVPGDNGPDGQLQQELPEADRSLFNEFARAARAQGVPQATVKRYLADLRNLSRWDSNGAGAPGPARDAGLASRLDDPRWVAKALQTTLGGPRSTSTLLHCLRTFTKTGRVAIRRKRSTHGRPATDTRLIDRLEVLQRERASKKVGGRPPRPRAAGQPARDDASICASRGRMLSTWLHQEGRPGLAVSLVAGTLKEEMEEFIEGEPRQRQLRAELNRLFAGIEPRDVVAVACQGIDPGGFLQALAACAGGQGLYAVMKKMKAEDAGDLEQLVDEESADGLTALGRDYVATLPPDLKAQAERHLGAWAESRAGTFVPAADAAAPAGTTPAPGVPPSPFDETPSGGWPYFHLDSPWERAASVTSRQGPAASHSNVGGPPLLSDARNVPPDLRDDAHHGGFAVGVQPRAGDGPPPQAPGAGLDAPAGPAGQAVPAPSRGLGGVYSGLESLTSLPSLSDGGQGLDTRSQEVTGPAGGESATGARVARWRRAGPAGMGTPPHPGRPQQRDLRDHARDGTPDSAAGVRIPPGIRARPQGPPARLVTDSTRNGMAPPRGVAFDLNTIPEDDAELPGAPERMSPRARQGEPSGPPRSMVFDFSTGRASVTAPARPMKRPPARPAGPGAKPAKSTRDATAPKRAENARARQAWQGIAAEDRALLERLAVAARAKGAADATLSRYMFHLRRLSRWASSHPAKDAGARGSGLAGRLDDARIAAEARLVDPQTQRSATTMLECLRTFEKTGRVVISTRRDTSDIPAIDDQLIRQLEERRREQLARGWAGLPRPQTGPGAIARDDAYGCARQGLLFSTSLQERGRPGLAACLVAGTLDTEIDAFVKGKPREAQARLELLRLCATIKPEDVVEVACKDIDPGWFVRALKDGPGGRALDAEAEEMTPERAANLRQLVDETSANGLTPLGSAYMATLPPDLKEQAERHLEAWAESRTGASRPATTAAAPAGTPQAFEVPPSPFDLTPSGGWPYFHLDSPFESAGSVTSRQAPATSDASRPGSPKDSHSSKAVASSPGVVDLEDYQPGPEREKRPRPPAAQRLAGNAWLGDDDLLHYTRMAVRRIVEAQGPDMTRERARRLDERLAIADAAQVGLLMGNDPVRRAQVRRHLDAPIVLVPMNDANEHWSLLVVNRAARQAYHYDSNVHPQFASVTTGTRQMARARAVAGVLGAAEVLGMPTARQRDTHSCGDHVLFGIQELTRRMVDGERPLAWEGGAPARQGAWDLSTIRPDRQTIIDELTRYEEFAQAIAQNPHSEAARQPLYMDAGPGKKPRR